MISKILTLILFLSACSNLAPSRELASTDKNILIIGDSHMAGPFGQILHQEVSMLVGSNTVTYGHAGSAPLHWLSQTRYALSGGVYHALSAHKTINPNSLVRMLNPNPTDWRVAVDVPSFNPLINDISIHPEWNQQDFPLTAPNFVVIELGANDRLAIYNNGQINQREFEKRKNLAREMALNATANGARCLWIGPPHGRLKTDEEQAAVYLMLSQALIDTDCELISSNHYKAMGCDGVHFNCREEMDNAKKWANEMAQKIKSLID